MPFTISELPLELVRSIVSFLNLEDFYNLRRVSKTLFYLLSGESTCSEVLEVE